MAGRYASALFELAQEAKSTDKVGADLIRFDALIAGSADLLRLVRSPVFSAAEQVDAVQAIMKKAKIGGLAAQFIALVASKRRLFAVRDMIRAYKTLSDADKGIANVEVTVAEKPSAKLLGEITAAIAGLAGKKVDIDLKIDPTILGGIVVKMGSRMVDTSLRTKLNGIRTAMKEVG
jgi:F-type H+-transporting ATPase subunit delta